MVPEMYEVARASARTPDSAKKKKCKFQNTNHFARLLQQNATDAFRQMISQAYERPFWVGLPE